MPLLVVDFASHSYLVLIVRGTFEDAKNPHAFDSMFLFTSW